MSEPPKMPDFRILSFSTCRIWAWLDFLIILLIGLAGEIVVFTAPWSWK
jgi:hypothetical protein